MNVLGIESSCDETGIALINDQQGLLAHALFSQVELHAQFGGVVPELASRDHIQRWIPLLKETLSKVDMRLKDIDAIAYTAGPGLVGALMVGACAGRALAWSLDIPAVPVHHMEGHLLAPLLEDNAPEPPFLALLVSGGHTLLVAVEGWGQYKILGESIDDAVGEAFDKTAKLLGLGYPGGPALAKLAEQGDPTRFRFPRPMTDRPGLEFSFSGLKTYAINTLQKVAGSGQDKADICRAFEEAVVDTMAIKCRRALDETGYTQLVVAGGVGANQRLRAKLTELLQSRSGQAFYPRMEFCTDNGAMIARAGLLRMQKGEINNELSVSVRPRWSLEEL